MPNSRNAVRTAASAIAILFGVVTVLAGGRVLLGADPGYAVFLPLLGFNTAMGIAYMAAGLLAWRRPRSGIHASAAIFILNLLALVTIGYLHLAHGSVATESLQAMGFRTLVWLVLLLGLVWATRHSNRPKAEQR